jgi:hypothetical protein
MLLTFPRKYKRFKVELSTHKISPSNVQVLNLLDKDTKVAQIYYLFYYYLRLIYKNLILTYIFKTSAIINRKRILDLYIKQHIRKKEKNIYRNKIKKNKEFLFKKIKNFPYRFFNYLIVLFFNKNIYLSNYLEYLGSKANLRNISKLSSLFKFKIQNIFLLRRSQLFKLILNIKKYIWQYKKIILERVQLRKLNVFIQFITYFSSAKYSIINYLYFKLHNTEFFNYISWFIFILSINLRELFNKFSYININNLFLKCIKTMFFKFNSILLLNVLKKKKNKVDVISSFINYKGIPLYFNNNMKGIWKFKFEKINKNKK